MKRGKPLSRRARGRGGDEPEQVLYLPVPLGPGDVARVEGTEADHALRSLRLRTGDPVWLVDGQGLRHRGAVLGLDKRALGVRIEVTERVPSWPGRSVLVGAGVLRTARMETLVEKASELGATGFTPLLLRRCVARPEEEGLKAERWHRIAVESLKQSKRAELMRVEDPVPLDAFLAGLPGARRLLVAAPDGEDPSGLKDLAGNEDPLVAVVGPEGGLAEEEVALLARHGARFVHLGGHRLRAETAGIALLCLALAGAGRMCPVRDLREDSKYL